MNMIKFVTDDKKCIFVVAGTTSRDEAAKFMAAKRKIGILTVHFNYTIKPCVVKNVKRKGEIYHELYWDSKDIKGKYINGVAFYTKERR